MEFDTINNRLCKLLSDQPELVNASNDDIVEAYRDMFDEEGRKRTPSESITRALRKLREDGFYLPNKDRQDEIKNKEKEYREYYGR